MKVLPFLACVVVGSASLGTAQAADEGRDASYLQSRCSNDLLTSVQAKNRNAWAVKCAGLSADTATVLNGSRMYVNFEEQQGGLDDPLAACWQRKPTIVAVCVVKGSFTATQRVLFGGTYWPIGSAQKDGMLTVSTPVSLAPPITRIETPIQAFVYRETVENVLAISMPSGLVIQVTQDHPMVASDGSIIPASSVTAGTALLTVNGAEFVSLVQIFSYSGLVWNVMPNSTDSLANIIFAEDFLTGSARYQDKWAQDMTRLVLREVADTDM